MRLLSKFMHLNIPINTQWCYKKPLGFFLYSILIKSSVIPVINNSGKVGRAVDFNAILIVAVENWLWELHDVEYHGVHLINLSKSSRFVSVNHMSERQKTGAELYEGNERKPYFIRTLSKQIKKLCEHTTFQWRKLISVCQMSGQMTLVQ